MISFCVDPQVFQRLPGACFGVVVAKGIDNATNLPQIGQLLEQAVQLLRERLDGVTLKEHPAFLPYREAFQRLGINPNKFPGSVEALSKRVLKGNALPGINPIVDIGNAMSLKYILPMGAHDIRKLSGNLTVRFSLPEDRFLPFGEINQETPDEGELIYVSGNTVKTRRWIWRQSDDGKIDASSTDVVFPIDGFLGRNDDAVLSAREELAGLLRELFGCRVVTGLLTEENRSFPLE